MKRKRIISIILSIALVLSTLTITTVSDKEEAFAAQTISNDFNDNLIKEASTYLGLRYQLGGRNPSVLDAYEGTLDCSGFVYRVLSDLGVGNVPLATGGHSRGSAAGWGSYGWLYKIYYKTLSLTYNGVTFNANNGNMIYADSLEAFNAAVNNPAYNGNSIIVLRTATPMASLEPYLKTGMIVLMSDASTDGIVTQAAHMMMVADTIEPNAYTYAGASAAEVTVRYAEQAASELSSKFVTKSLYSGTNYIYKTCTLGFESTAYSAIVSKYGKKYGILTNTPFTGHQDFYCVINHAQDGFRHPSVADNGIGTKVWYIEAALSPHSVCFSNKASAMGYTPCYVVYFNAQSTDYYATMNISKSRSGSEEKEKDVTYAWSASREVIASVAENGNGSEYQKLSGTAFDYSELEKAYSTSVTGSEGIAGMPPVCFGKDVTKTVYVTELTEKGSGRYYEVSLNGTSVTWGANTSINSVVYYSGNNNGVALKNEVSSTGSYYQFAGTIIYDKYYENYVGFELREADVNGSAKPGNVYLVTMDEATAEIYEKSSYANLDDAKKAIGNSDVAFMYVDEKGHTSFSGNVGGSIEKTLYILQIVCTEDRVPLEGYLEVKMTSASDEGSNIENAVKASRIVSINRIWKDDEGKKVIESYTNYANLEAALSVLNIRTKYSVGSFKDLNYDAYYIDHVRYVYDKNVITGLDEETFAPALELSRTMAVTILYRMAGSPETEVTEKPFDDVATDTWYSKAVKWAKDNKIVNGYTEGEKAGLFGVRDTILRQDFMKMLYSYAKYMRIDVSVDDEEAFKTAEDWLSVSSYAIPMVNWGYKLGLIGNNSPLKAKDTINRGQTATIISRFLQTEFTYLEPEEEPTEEETEETGEAESETETEAEETGDSEESTEVTEEETTEAETTEAETEESETSDITESEASDSETTESETSESENAESETVESETVEPETEPLETRPEIIPPSETYTELDTVE